MRKPTVLFFDIFVESHLHGDVGVDKLHLPLAEALLLGVDAVKMAIDHIEAVVVGRGMALQLVDGMPGAGEVPVRGLDFLTHFLLAPVDHLLQLANADHHLMVPVQSTLEMIHPLLEPLPLIFNLLHPLLQLLKLLSVGDGFRRLDMKTRQMPAGAAGVGGRLVEREGHAGTALAFDIRVQQNVSALPTW